MNHSLENTRPIQENELIVRMAINAWEMQLKRVESLLNEISDEQLEEDVAPGRNSGIYLLGHLVAVTDNMFPLLGMGEKKYPHLYEIFVSNPDKSGFTMPSVEVLKQNWTEVNTRLGKYFEEWPPEEWFKKHTTISEEDFAREPFRNKLNVILNRTAHMAYHIGQLVFLKPKQ